MKIFTLTLLLLSLSTLSIAQNKIKAVSSSEKMSVGLVHCFTVSIYEASTDDIEKAWKKLMKDYKAKVSGGNEIFADDATITALSANTIDVYARIEKVNDTESKLVAAFDLGGAYVSSGSSQAKQTEQILETFATSTTKSAIEQQLAEAENALKKLTREKENLIRENETLHKKITGWEEDIKQAKDDIVTNEKNQETNVKDIEDQGKVIEGIKEKGAQY